MVRWARWAVRSFSSGLETSARVRCSASLRVAATGTAAGVKNCSHGLAGRGDHRSPGRRDFKDAPGAHAGRVHNRIDVEENLVGLVGGQGLGISQRTDHARVQRCWELVLGVAAKLAGEYLQPRPHPGGRVQRTAEEKVHLGTAFGILMGKVHSGKGNVPLVPAVSGPHGIVDRRLGRERKHGYAVMPEIRGVLGYAAGIRREDVVKQPGSGQEILVVRRVFLVPENRGDSLLPAPLDQLAELVAGSVGAGQLAAPQSAVSGPGRLDEQEVNGAGRQVAAPGVGVHGAGGPLVAEGQGGKVVQDHRGADVRPGRLVLWKGGRNQREPAFAPRVPSRPLPRPARCGARRSPVRSARRDRQVLYCARPPLRRCHRPVRIVPETRHQPRLRREDRPRTSVATRFALASSRILAAEMLLPLDRWRVKS